MNTRSKNRLILLTIAALFIGPLALAFLFNAEGWRPAQTRNNGILVEPARDVSGVGVTLADGSRFPWRVPSTWPWTLVVLPGSDCGNACRERIDELLRMRITLGRNAERVRVLYLGPDLGAEALAARQPLAAGHEAEPVFAAARPSAPDAVALALVDPNGLWMMRYDAGYNAGKVREDLTRVLH